MKKMNCIMLLNLIAFSVNAATYSGTVENKFGDFIGFTALTATNTETSEEIEFPAGRSGTFAVELSEGTWIIEADSTQIAEWGYAQLSGYELTILGSDFAQDVVLYASEPLQEPKLEIYRNQFGTLRLSLNGQGGTRFIVERSYDLKSWHSYYETTTAKGGLTTSANAPSGASNTSEITKLDVSQLTNSILA
jgi:hypothetical protein